MRKKRLIAIVGATGAGKTDWSLDVAEKVGGEIVSADSRQIYRGMDIGTAKVQDARGIPHYLIDIREPNEPLTLAEWQMMAFEEIDEIMDRGKIPVLVGGTMLYIDSVVRNYDIPEVPPDPAFRERKQKIENRKLYKELLEQDPEAKAFIEPHHKQRIIRALEVMAATGKRISALRQAQGKQEPKYEVKMIGLFPGWDKLRERIEARAKWMIENGLLEETKRLRETLTPGPSPSSGRGESLLNTMNYRQAGEVLDGKMAKREAVDSMARENMRYARRQMSWWKGREEIEWVTTPS